VRADGKRVRIHPHNVTPTVFVYQGPDMLKLQMEKRDNGDTVAQYTMGAGGALEAQRRSEDTSVYHFDALGSTLALTDADEAVTDTWRHDAWGVLLTSTGAIVNPHTYIGRERYYGMPHADLYHLGFRDYAPGVGRFTTVDLGIPLRTRHARPALTALMPMHGLSLTATSAPVPLPPDWLYVSNKPTGASDPSGLIQVPAWLLACLTFDVLLMWGHMICYWTCTPICTQPVPECPDPGQCPTHEEFVEWSRCLARKWTIEEANAECVAGCWDDCLCDAIPYEAYAGLLACGGKRLLVWLYRHFGVGGGVVAW